MSELPLVDLRAQHRSIRQEIADAIVRVVDSQHFIGGRETPAFEEEFASFCEGRHCLGVSSGTTALELALEALDIGPGDEVITVSHTFNATISSILSMCASGSASSVTIHGGPCYARRSIRIERKRSMPSCRWISFASGSRNGVEMCAAGSTG